MTMANADGFILLHLVKFDKNADDLAAHKRGEDDGCFASALASVRAFGGVLEHPAYSDAWPAFGLNAPPTGGGWVNADFVGGWTCYVEQWRYGHPAKKATWLYAHGVELPSLRWGHINDRDMEPLQWVSWCSNRNGHRGEEHPRIGKARAAATPMAFRDELIGIARSVEVLSKRQRSATPIAFRDELIGIVAGSARRTEVA